MAEHRIYSLPFTDLYPLYLAKVERKGRTAAELNAVLSWLTGYEPEAFPELGGRKYDLRAFFDNAPALNEQRALVTGSICGVKIQELEDPLMKLIRIMDKIVDELAKGKALDKIMRS